MTINIKIESRVDSELVIKAEQEIYQILLQQRFAFNDRFHDNKTANNIIKILRLIFLVLCILIVAFYLVPYLYNSSKFSLYPKDVVYLVLFTVMALVFYYLPVLEKLIKKFTKNTNKQSCKKIAARCVKKAKKLAPYHAEYDFKGDLITYFRASGEGEKAVWKLAWFRRLKGVAIHGEFTTVIFKKWTSIHPKIIILHKDFSPIKNVLDALNIEYKKIKGSESEGFPQNLALPVIARKH